MELLFESSGGCYLKAGVLLSAGTRGLGIAQNQKWAGSAGFHDRSVNNSEEVRKKKRKNAQPSLSAPIAEPG